MLLRKRLWSVLPLPPSPQPQRYWMQAVMAGGRPESAWNGAVGHLALPYCICQETLVGAVAANPWKLTSYSKGLLVVPSQRLFALLWSCKFAILEFIFFSGCEEEGERTRGQPRVEGWVWCVVSWSRFFPVPGLLASIVMESRHSLQSHPG